ncbi:hypothetical protein CTEN210_09788 [Chaetoceros tenuissimus]|uniref:Uncharacterized protein n=1 Tax=Chaetoceros tenuissimus TaxID=426638 RepID=A0AAD3H7D1_9STRA|nr:hypothetical protein CTEN210_09788 [Chaetoceros tenuissimus]
MTQARKRMRLEGGSDGMLLEPSATMNDLPSEVIKSIFSYVGKGNYCFVAPVSKDFCFNYLTMNVIEDKFAHKLDYLQAIDRNKITTVEAASFSLELAEYCFFKAPEDFQRRVVNRAIREGRIDIVEMADAMGVDVKNLSRFSREIVEVARKGNLEMLKFIYGKHSNIHELEYLVIETSARKDQLEVLKWLYENEMLPDKYIDIIFGSATLGGNLEIVKWTESTFNCRCPERHFRNAVESGNVELVKYLKHITWCESTLCIPARIGNIELLQYLFEKGGQPLYLYQCNICTSAIENNNFEKAFEVLQWLHQHGVPWDEKTCVVSASVGNLKALKYARVNGCPWNEECLEKAIHTRDLELVEYCLENGCPMGTFDSCRLAMYDKDHDRALRMLKLLRRFSVPWSNLTCSIAAGKGNFEALKWAVFQGCSWSRQECVGYAAEHGDIEVLKWMRSRGCEWDEYICARAAKKGHIETLKFLISEGSPCNEYTFSDAILSGDFAMIKYCVDNDIPPDSSLYEYAIATFDDPIPIIKLLRKKYPWNSNACSAAAYKGNLKLLRWLRFKGCPWDDYTCTEAVKKNHYEILKYAHENGCAWDEYTYAYCFSKNGLYTFDTYEQIPTKHRCSDQIIEYIRKHNCPQPAPDEWILH